MAQLIFILSPQCKDSSTKFTKLKIWLITAADFASKIFMLIPLLNHLSKNHHTLYSLFIYHKKIY